MEPFGSTKSDNDIRELILRVSQGSEDAARELVREYGEQMRRTIRRVLNPKL
jgi:hypothetical protein